MISLATLKLPQEPHVVLREQTQVFHSVFEVRDTLYAHTEGVAAVLLAVDTAGLKDVRIDHTATEDLHPSCAFAERAALAAADVTTDIHLRTRLREREITRTQTNLCLRTEHLLAEIQQRLTQVSKTNVFVDIQTFYLVEETMRASGDCLVTIYSTRA